MPDRPAGFMTDHSILMRVRAALLSDRFFEDRIEEVLSAEDPAPLLAELLDAYRAELAENTGVLQALRRQRDTAEEQVRRVREWAGRTEQGAAAAEVLAIIGSVAGHVQCDEDIDKPQQDEETSV